MSSSPCFFGLFISSDAQFYALAGRPGPGRGFGGDGDGRVATCGKFALICYNIIIAWEDSIPECIRDALRSVSTVGDVES